MKQNIPILMITAGLSAVLSSACSCDVESSLTPDAQIHDSAYPDQFLDAAAADQSQDRIDSPDPITVYPDPALLGFHHAALIYGRNSRSSDDLLLYAAHTVDGKPDSWLFDAFLFLLTRIADGNGTEIGPTYKADWQAHIDTWFSTGRDLSALDQAIENAANVLGPPPSKRKIIFSIPYPNPEVTDFGDVNGDNQTENLGRPEDVDRVLDWYLTQIQQRFNNAGFRHLELWGAYWMNETLLPRDHRNCRAVADWLHARGMRFLWIPYFSSQGHSEWKEAGFDLTLLQPNYAFWEQHYGAKRRNLLRIASDQAQQLGMGIEIEMSGHPRRRPADLLWRHYLRDGASDRGGYQKGPTAYYLSTDNIETLARSKDERVRSLYDDLAVYVRGERVTEPDRSLSWVDKNGASLAIDSSGWGKPFAINSAQSKFPETLTVADLTVYIDEPESQTPWTGFARVQYLVPGTDTWRPAGWTLRKLRNQSHLRHQFITVPVGRPVDGLRVTFDTESGSPPHVTGLAPLERGPLPDIDSNVALGLPYTFEPAPPALYPDRGSQLNDALICQDGYADKRAVGWFNSNAGIHFDLGEIHTVDKVRIHVQGGGNDGIYWPAESVLLLGTTDKLIHSTSGFSHLNEPIAWASPQDVVIDKTIAADIMLGHIDYQLKPNTQARFLSLLIKSVGWLMVSEVEVFSNGTNIAPRATYTLLPSPTVDSNAAGPYPDNGIRLTSGIIAEYYGVHTTGWHGPEPRIVTVDLQKKHPIREVTIWSLTTRMDGIGALKTVEIWLSDDGLTWHKSGIAVAGTAPAHLEGAEPYTLKLDQQARFVRARITAGNGWAMISQIEVKVKRP